MTISSKIIADSTNELGVRLTTFQLMYPRYIHAEIMTHRVFSRNASSSRAIPVAKSIDRVEQEPAIPPLLADNQRGMQPGTEVDAMRYGRAMGIWKAHREMSIEMARELAELGIHKQWVNRLLETHSHIHVILTGTEFDNFFKLRCSPMAQAEFRILAEGMRDQYKEHEPQKRHFGQWHLPYVIPTDTSNGDTALRAGMVSAARCARVSYLAHDGTQPSWEKDLDLARRLQDDHHMSPFEHAAMCSACSRTPAECGNFGPGWIQFRKMIEALPGKEI